MAIIPSADAYFIVQSAFGDVLGLVKDESLVFLHLLEKWSIPEHLPELPKDQQQRYQESIDSVFAGKTPEFWPDLKPTGTEFQQKVWQALLQIPKGEVWSYTELGSYIGAVKGAARAVGSACGANPIALYIPCHRVLRQDGDLGGFAWGLPVKEHLLRVEAKSPNLELEL